MSNERYVKSREAAYQGEIDLLTADVRFAAVRDTYSPNTTTDEFLSGIPSGAILASSDVLTGKFIAGAVFGADGVTFSGNPGDPENPVIAKFLIGYVDTADPATSRVLVKVDTAASNLPITLNGSDVTVLFPDGEIFDL